jgi:hypothetical protein
MTPDERNMLQDLANKVAQTPAPAKDVEAEDFIRKNIGSRPDALYLMTQTVLIQNLALQRAQQQIQDLQQRAAQPAPVSSGSSFLGGQGPRPTGYSQPAGQAYPPPPQYAPPTQTVANPGGGASSFLRGAAQTAAGVAGGVLAADAISSLFGHGGGFGGFGGGFMGGGAPVEEVVNNYYEAPPQNDTGDYGNYNDPNAGDQGQYDQAQDDQGQYDDGGQYQDAGYDTGDDGGGFDDSGDNFA